MEQGEWERLSPDEKKETVVPETKEDTTGLSCQTCNISRAI